MYSRSTLYATTKISRYIGAVVCYCTRQCLIDSDSVLIRTNQKRAVMLRTMLTWVLFVCLTQQKYTHLCFMYDNKIEGRKGVGAAMQRQEERMYGRRIAYFLIDSCAQHKEQPQSFLRHLARRRCSNGSPN